MAVFSGWTRALELLVSRSSRYGRHVLRAQLASGEAETAAVLEQATVVVVACPPKKRPSLRGR